jgi:alpha-beta hydrolase superfamily lysophospholipase
MNHSALHWKTEDGLTLYGQAWQPESEPKAVVCLVHGLGEHSGRYAHVGAAFNQAGYALLAFDLRGHGKSEGPRGHTPSFEAFMRDIDQFLQQAEQRFPGRPRFLYGHSLGGILVLNYALRRRPALAGVIVTSPGLHTALEQQTAKVTLARVLGRMLPAVALSSGLNPNDISRDPAVVQAYVNDPLVHDRITFGMSVQLLHAISYALDHAAEFPLPLLLVHGTADRLAFPTSSTEVAAAVRGECTLKLWDGLYHETHNEPEQKEVLAFTIAWMDKRLPGTVGTAG